MTRDEFIQYFEQTTKRMVETCRVKNADYAGKAGETDPFSNFTRVESLGIASAEQGFLTRMTDKFCRVATFVSTGVLAVKDEVVEDTLIDLASYCVILAAYIQSKREAAK